MAVADCLYSVLVQVGLEVLHSNKVVNHTYKGRSSAKSRMSSEREAATTSELSKVPSKT